MPQRPRSHVLETESQRAFASALPSDLVVREVTDDYGTDREVEVFVAGETTGLTFKVQLKATDKSGKSVRVKQSSLDYWMSLDIPVLLVTYEAGTKRLRGRWVHSIGADGPPTGAATVTVSMDPSIDIEETWAARLANDLTLIRAVRRGDIPNPTPVRVVVDSDLPLSQSRTVAALLRVGRQTSWPMRAPLDEDEAALIVTFSRKRAQGALPLQMGSCTLHVEGSSPNLGSRDAADLALMLCAGAVSAVNDACARAWVAEIDPISPWWSIPTFSERLLSALDHPDTATLVLEIHAHMVERGDPNADLFITGVMNQAVSIAPDAFEAYSDRIRASLGTDWEGGRQAFNLSSAHRLRRDFAAALELLEVTAARAPRYLDDCLYHRHRGACLWELDRFEESAESYKRAIVLGIDPHEVRPLLADSLMHAGRFAEARATLNGWEPIGDVSDKAGHIRLVMLDHLLAATGVQRQDRTNFSEEQATERYQAAWADGTLDDATIKRLLHDTDALDPSLWIHLIGVEENRVNFEPALITAFMLSREPMSWVLALIGALEAGVDEPILRAVIDQARYLCKDDFYDAVMEFADEQEEEQATFLRELISTAYTRDLESFEHLVRCVDPSRAAWVVDVVQYPSS